MMSLATEKCMRSLALSLILVIALNMCGQRARNWCRSCELQ